MKINEAVILAGGLGTRLRSAVSDLPKCMAPVAGRPFIDYIIHYYSGQGIDKFIFSLGYKHEAFEEHLSLSFPNLNYTCVIEEEPLGTGGALRFACKAAKTSHVLALNGDTFFEIDLAALTIFHNFCKSHCTLTLKPMKNTDRYGLVSLAPDYRVHSFREKSFYEEGLINGGVYALNKDVFLNEDLPDTFSFEKEYLEKLYTERRMFGHIQDRYFIDIGIPDDYLRAQTELNKFRI